MRSCVEALGPGGVWVHLLESLAFPPGVTGRHLRELKCSQAVVLDTLTRGRYLLLDAMEGRYPEGAEAASTQRE